MKVTYYKLTKTCMIIIRNPNYFKFLFDRINHNLPQPGTTVPPLQAATCLHWLSQPQAKASEKVLETSCFGVSTAIQS